MDQLTPRHMRLEVTGMQCAACVRRAENALKKVPGVTDARVNLATRRADLDLGGPVSPVEAAEALQKAGYPAAETMFLLQVTGATCGSCTRRVEAALSAVPGVQQATFNLATGQARVQALAGAVTLEDLIAAVSQAGYQASEMTDGDTTADAAEGRQKSEIDALKRDTLTALALAIPVALLSMSGHVVPALQPYTDSFVSHLIQLVLTTVAMAWPGARFFRSGVHSLMRLAPEMNALVVVGTSAAWIYSTFATLAPGLMPAGAAHVYFEAAAIIITLILAGRWMEARARGRASAAIRRLAGLQVREAMLRSENGALSAVPVSALQPGDEIALKPGDRFPVDGEIVEGQSDIDEAMVTGEPIPASKGPGDPVIAGTVNGAGALIVRATATGQDTMLSHIMQAVEEAQGTKLPVQNLVDRIAQVFVPAVMLAALVTFVAWLAFGGGLAHALVAAVSVLVVACPCAMGLAVPVSIMVGTGRASELGALFRRGDALQRLQSAAIVAFDKTGTLTEGRPVLTGIIARGQEDETLALLAAVEAQSEHPIGRAVLAAAEERGLTLPEVSDVTAHAGQGLEARVDGAVLRIGNLGFFSAPLPDDMAERAVEWEGEGRTVLYAQKGEHAMAVLAVSDRIREEAPQVVATLRRLGLEPAIITGDSLAAAGQVASELGVNILHAGVKPEEKAYAVKELQKKGAVLFVGDGINDAPALASADIGMAMGSGTDVAMEAAEIVLISPDLRGVVTALEISRKTMANIRENLFWAFAYNVALIPVAAGLLVLFGGPVMSPIFASAAMALSSVIVVSNALRLRRAGGRTGDAAVTAAG